MIDFSPIHRLTWGLLGLMVLCPPVQADSQLRFEDVTEKSGIDFEMTCGSTPSRHILEVDGGGVALLDFDNDGDWDVFFANGSTLADPEQGPGSRLYLNKGDGTFEDATERVGLKLTRWAMGVAVGDYDADGFDDVYVTCFGKNVLLRNAEGKRFVDVSENAKVADARWGSSAAFGDIDGDGDLDLYVVNYLSFDPRNPPSRDGKEYKGTNVMAGPHGLKAQADILYENKGDGTFRDVTQSSGCGSVTPGYGLVVRMVDVDGDDRHDIFVGSDSTENFLFRNLGGGRFRDDGVLSGLASNMEGTYQATMGVAFGDVDGNGRPDVFTTSFSSDTNTLHLNLDGEFFDDRTHQFGLGIVSRPFLTWGAGMYDFDGDRDEDIYVACGHVYPEAETHKIDSDYRQPALLFEKVRSTRFERATHAGPFFEEAISGRSVAFGDLDGDGDVDIIQTTLNGRPRILRNAVNGLKKETWLTVRLRQPGGNHRAFGSRITLIDEAGGRQTRWLTGGGSYQSVDAPEVYFGLGSAKDAAPETYRLEIVWPNGKQTQYDSIRGGTRLLMDREGVTHKTALE